MQNTPAPGRPLPRGSTAYGRGKRLEAEGDLRGAYECFIEALMRGDRTDSALKDISNIYVMFGRIEEAIGFLKKNGAFVTNRRGYENLILRLQQELDLEKKTTVTEAMPRSLVLTKLEENENFTTTYMAKIFPNAPKIRRVLIMDTQRALVQFATYSSARKAFNVLSSDERVEWAAKEDEALMEELEKMEDKKEIICMQNRQLQSLPYNLQVFNDERSLVSFYYISDKVVLEIVEKLLFAAISETQINHLATSSPNYNQY
jgi:tetratricopeptide (TPR) repeat protein